MKITIKNLLGIQSASIEAGNVTVIAGGNGTGKSSIAAAIRMAMTGQIERVDLKKQVGELVHNGAKDYGVLVENGNTQYSFGKLYGGKHAPAADHQLIGITTGAIKMAELKRDDLQKLLIELAGVSLSPDAVSKSLTQSGFSTYKIQIVMTHLVKSWEHAEAAAKNQATESRGQWKAVTGETYGETKAVSWLAEKPIVTNQGALVTLKDNIALREVKIERLKVEKTKAELENKAIERLRSELALHRELAEKELDRRELLLSAEKQLNEHDAEIKRLEVLASGSPAPIKYACPCCTSELMWSNNELHKWDHEGKSPDPEAKAALKRMIESRPVRDASVNRHRQAVEDSQKSATHAERISQDLEGKRLTPINDIDADLRQLVHDLKNEQMALELLQANIKAAETADNRTSKAAAHHADVVEWLRIADELAPTGLRQKLVTQAVTEFNALTSVYTTFGLQMVRIGNDMAVTLNDRPYYLRSKSEQWRVNALLALTVARMTNSKLVILDEFDILAPGSRPAFLKLFKNMTDSGYVSNIIVCATLKEPPKLPFVVYWLEHGQATNMADLQLTIGPDVPKFPP